MCSLSKQLSGFFRFAVFFSHTQHNALAAPVFPLLHNRVWDCLLLEGGDVLFRSSVGILRLIQKDLLSCSDTMSVLPHSLSSKPKFATGLKS
jgi:hypothetical protein